MRYRSIAPEPALAPWVECFWSLTDDGPASAAPEPVWPDGCIELIVHLGRPFRALTDDGALAAQPVSFLVGQMVRPMVLQAAGAVATFGVRFRPGGARPFFGVPLGEVAGKTVALAALWGVEAAALESALAEAWSEGASRPTSRLALERVVHVTGRTLLRRLDSQRRPPAEVDLAVARVMAARGAVRIESLAREVGWGTRRLERRFTDAVGLAPKPFARVVRFQALLASLPSREPDWVSLALDCGYFDQSHLAGEVRSLAGVTPSALTSGGDRLAAIFTSRERLDAYFGA